VVKRATTSTAARKIIGMYTPPSRTRRSGAQAAAAPTIVRRKISASDIARRGVYPFTRITRIIVA